LPEVEDIGRRIFDGITNYMYENLPQLVLDESQVGYAVNAVQD
jgi:hypothetical protein